MPRQDSRLGRPTRQDNVIPGTPVVFEALDAACDEATRWVRSKGQNGTEPTEDAAEEGDST